MITCLNCGHRQVMPYLNIIRGVIDYGYCVHCHHIMFKDFPEEPEDLPD